MDGTWEVIPVFAPAVAVALLPHTAPWFDALTKEMCAVLERLADGLRLAYVGGQYFPCLVDTRAVRLQSPVTLEKKQKRVPPMVERAAAERQR